MKRRLIELKKFKKTFITMALAFSSLSCMLSFKTFAMESNIIGDIPTKNTHNYIKKDGRNMYFFGEKGLLSCYGFDSYLVADNRCDGKKDINELLFFLVPRNIEDFKKIVKGRNLRLSFSNVEIPGRIMFDVVARPYELNNGDIFYLAKINLNKISPLERYNVYLDVGAEIAEVITEKVSKSKNLFDLGKNLIKGLNGERFLGEHLGLINSYGFNGKDFEQKNIKNQMIRIRKKLDYADKCAAKEQAQQEEYENFKELEVCYLVRESEKIVENTRIPVGFSTIISKASIDWDRAKTIEFYYDEECDNFAFCKPLTKCQDEEIEELIGSGDAICFYINLDYNKKIVDNFEFARLYYVLIKDKDGNPLYGGGFSATLEKEHRNKDSYYNCVDSDDDFIPESTNNKINKNEEEENDRINEIKEEDSPLKVSANLNLFSCEKKEKLEPLDYKDYIIHSYYDKNADCLREVF